MEEQIYTVFISVYLKAALAASLLLSRGNSCGGSADAAGADAAGAGNCGAGSSGGGGSGGGHRNSWGSLAGSGSSFMDITADSDDGEVEVSKEVSKVT